MTSEPAIVATNKLVAYVEGGGMVIDNKEDGQMEVVCVLRKETVGVRTRVMNSYNKGMFAYWWLWRMSRKDEYPGVKEPEAQLRDAFALIGYGAFYSPKRGGKRRVRLVDVDAMVEKWVPVVIGIATAHDRDERDTFEGKVDELLTPFLNAPVKQIREFYGKLLTAMKADKRVPWIVWEMFESYGESFVETAPDEAVKQLKTDLAQQIVDMSEAEIKPQIGEAIVNALKWRSPEQLEAVKKSLEAGEKPRLKGKESCLFFEVGEGEQAVSVML